jgi:hypothetical protein
MKKTSQYILPLTLTLFMCPSVVGAAVFGKICVFFHMRVRFIKEKLNDSFAKQKIK